MSDNYIVVSILLQMTEISIIGSVSDNSSLLNESIEGDDDKEEGELSMSGAAEDLEALLTEEAQRLEKEIQEPKESELKSQKVGKVPATSTVKFDAPPPPGVKIFGDGGMCLVCRKKFTRMANLRRHWQMIHEKKIPKFKCAHTECRTECVRVDDLVRHGVNKHGWSQEEADEVKHTTQWVLGTNFKYRSPKGRSGPPEEQTRIKGRVWSRLGNFKKGRKQEIKWPKVSE